MPLPRVKILIQRFSPVVGGMERQCQAVVSTLIAQGWDINVWTRRPSPGLCTLGTIEGIPVRRFGRGTHTHLDIILVLIQQFIALLRNRQQYDIIHIYGAGHLAMTGLLVGKLTRKPVIIRPATYSDVTRYLQGNQSVTSTLLGRLYHTDPLKLKLRLFQNTTIWAALTQEIEEEIIALPFAPQSIVRIANGVDTNRYKPISHNEKVMLRQQHHLPSDAVIFLFIGRFVPRKGLVELLEAWENLSQTGNNIHLLLIGSGKGQIDSIETEVVEKVAILSEVTCLGLKQNPTIYYQLADVLVFPSHREGMPNVLLEGMACGLAPIVTRIGGVLDIVNDERDCLMIEPQNSEQLAQAMHKLAANKEKRQAIAKVAQKTVFEQYSLVQTVKQYAALYQGAIGEYD